jgi:hypothetical protein
MGRVTQMIGGLFGGGPKRNEALERANRRQLLEEKTREQELTADDESRRIRAARGGRLRALAYQGGKPSRLGASGG